MQNHKLVLPEHLNQYGFLFGGHLLRWVDEAAWIAASLDYPGWHFVTVAMDRVEFRKPVRGGAILRIEIDRVAEGTTSARYQVQVFREGDPATSPEPDPIFSTCVTLVHVDEEGRKQPLRPL